MRLSKRESICQIARTVGNNEATKQKAESNQEGKPGSELLDVCSRGRKKAINQKQTTNQKASQQKAIMQARGQGRKKPEVKQES